MNIAVFIKKTTFHEGYGGLETQNKLLCEGLVSRGHKVVVFSPKFELTKESDSQNGVAYVFVESSYRALFGLGHLSRNNWLKRSVDEFLKMHKSSRFDFVLGQSSAALGIIYRKNEINIPVISISHGSTVGEYKTFLQGTSSLKDILMVIPNTGYFLLNFFGRQRKFILHSNHIIAVSKAVKKALIDETFIPGDKISVIYNGILPPKESISQGLEKKNASVKILYVGLIHKSKGLLDLVNSIKGNEFKNVLLEIVGGGPYLESLKKIVVKKGLEGRVRFLGKVPYEEVLSIMRDSDIFVLPSKRVEGFPMTLVEAMFSHLPIIGARIGGIPEAIEDNATGIVYESGDVTGLKIALKKLVDSSDLRVSMGKAGYEKARRELTLDVMLTKYEETFKNYL